MFYTTYEIHGDSRVACCRRTIYDDPFIRNYIEDLLKKIRTQVGDWHDSPDGAPVLLGHVSEACSSRPQQFWCMQVVLKLIQPYTRIRIPFVSQQLNIPEYDVEQLLVALILDSRIQGHIDQVHLCILHQTFSSRLLGTETPLKFL